MMVKRAFDLAFAAAAIVAVSPLMIVTAIVIRVCMGNPVLFRHERAGRAGRSFEVLKFRTMRAPLGLRWDVDADQQRLTRIGAVLRRWSIDELPQLFNVVRGDMSIVGPRPLPLCYVERYNLAQRRRLTVLPGITGWAQVNGRNAITWTERLEYDAWYVDHQSLGLDLRIILRTVSQVVRGAGVSHANHATMPEFLGE